MLSFQWKFFYDTVRIKSYLVHYPYQHMIGTTPRWSPQYKFSFLR